MTRKLAPLFDGIRALASGQPHCPSTEIRAIEVFESAEVVFQRLLVQTIRPVSRHKDQRDGIEWIHSKVDVDLRIGGETKPSRIGTRWTPNPWNKLFQLGSEGTYLGHFFLLVRKNGEEDVLYKTADSIRKVGDSSLPDAVRIALIKSDHNPNRMLGE